MVAVTARPLRRLRLDGAARLRVLQVLAVAGVGAIAAALAWAMENRSYDFWATFPVAVGLVVLSVPLLRRAAAAEHDPRIAKLLWWAFGLKLLAAVPRYVVAFDLYDGSADANAYSRIGADLSRQFWNGDFTVDLGKEVVGTGFIEILTGVVYSITGATTLGGFLVFSWMGFWGLYLFHRAFARAVPDGDHWRYARLVLLLPSLLFWPSSIGKEAWMCMGLGVVAYGAARLLTAARGGLLLLGGGFGLLALVRPHVGALVAFAAFLAYVLRRPPKGASIFAPIGKLAVVVILGLGLVYSVAQLETFFGVDDFNQEAVQTTFNEVRRNTGQGGSQFIEDTDTDLEPTLLPSAFVNVLFRPFPWQATNAQALVAAAESAFLMALFVTSWRRIAAAAISILRRPYVAFCGAYTLLFVFGFSAFSNAGILVRQRVQVLPFVLVLLCVPATRTRWRGDLQSAGRGPRNSVDREVAGRGRWGLAR